MAVPHRSPELRRRTPDKPPWHTHTESVVGPGFIVELAFLDGATKLGSHEHHSLVTFR